MPTVYFRQFDVVRYDAAGVLIPLVSTTLTAYNETTAASLGTVSVNSSGVVEEGSFTATAGNIVLFTHASYPGKFRIELAASLSGAYEFSKYNAATFVVQNLRTASSAAEVDIYAQDIGNPNTPPILLGTGKIGETLEIPYQTNIEQNFRVYPVAKFAKGIRQESIDPDNYQAITIPATGGSSVTDGDKGDIVISGGGTIYSIEADAVTNAKAANMATKTYKGRTSAATGDPEDVPVATLKTDLVLVKADVGLGNVDNTPDASKPVSTAQAAADTVVQNFAIQRTNHTGTQAQSTVVNLVSDLAAKKTDSMSTNRLLGRGTAATGVIEEIALGTGLSLTGTTLNAAAGGDAYGPASSVDNAIARYDGTTGKLLQNSAPTIADTTGIISGTQGVNIAGSTSGAVNLRVPAAAGSNTLTLPAGTTDFSATGTVGGLVKQITGGGALAVSALKGEDLRVNFKTYYLNDTAYGHTNAGLAAAISAINSAGVRTSLRITEDVTISASQTIPTICVLEVENNAKITVSGGATLTINNFRDPGNVQCFAGVDASNHVVFAAGAVEKFNLAWYMGIGSAADCTFAMTDIFTSVTTATGGTVFVPAGSWKVNNLTCPQGVRFEGAGHGTDSSGVIASRFIPRDSSTTYLFRTLNNYRHFTAEYIAFSVGSNTTTRAFRFEGVSGNSLLGATFNHCAFVGNGATSHLPLVSDDNDQAYEVIGVNFYDCDFYVANNSKGARIYSINTQWSFDSCRFSVGSGDSFGIDAFNAGLYAVNNDFRGVAGVLHIDNAATLATLTGSITSGSTALTTTGGLTESMEGQKVYNAAGLASHFITKVNSSTSATLGTTATATISNGTLTVYRWGRNSAKAGCCILLGAGGLLTTTIDTNSDEGFNEFIRIVGNDTLTPITITNNRIQSYISVEGSSCIFANGNRFNSNVWQCTAGVSHIYGQNDYLNNTVEMANPASYNPLVTAHPWGPIRTGTLYFHEVGLLQGGNVDQQRYWKQILETTQSGLTRPILDVLTTYEDYSTSRQVLQRWGVADAASHLFKYGLQLLRDTFTSPGYYLWESTQENPYKGWLTDFPVGYASGSRGTVTQATSRTTSVTSNFPHGIITCYAVSSLAPGEIVTFQFFNSFIQNSDYVDVYIVDGASHHHTFVSSTRAGGGSCYLTIENRHVRTADTGTIKIHFHVVKDGGQAGIAL